MFTEQKVVKLVVVELENMKQELRTFENRNKMFTEQKVVKLVVVELENMKQELRTFDQPLVEVRDSL